MPTDMQAGGMDVSRYARKSQTASIKPYRLARRSATLAALAPMLFGVLYLSACADDYRASSSRPLLYTGGSSQTVDVDSRYGSYLAGRVATLRRDTDAAASYYETALDYDPDSTGLKRRAFLLNVAEGRIGRAAELVGDDDKEVSKLNLEQLVLAVHDIKKNQINSARARMALQVQGGTEVLLAPMMRAWIEAGDKDFDAAYKALEPLTKRSGFNSFYRYHYALLADLSGDAAAAEQAYKDLSESEARGSARAVLAEASFISRQQDPQKALAFLQSKSPLLQNNTLIRHAIKMLDAGKVLPRIVESAEHGIAESFYTTAGALAQDRSSEFVKIYSRLALHLRGDLDGVKMLLAEILQGDNRREEAIGIYRQVPQTSAYWLDAQLQMASELNQLDRVDDAIALLNDVAEKHPEETSAMVTLGDILRGHERYEEAIVAYSEAIAKIETPKEQDWVLFYSRGVANERAKMWDAAEKDFLQALDLKAEQPLVLNYLGYSWVEQRRNLARAEEMIELAVEKRPNDGYIVDSLGWVFFQLGRYEEAVTQLERAVELRPDDPVINDHLGDAYWKTGRQLEARFQWNHALVLDPEESDRAKIEAKLDLGLEAALRELAQN